MEENNNYYTYENKNPDYEDSKEKTADIPVEELNYFEGPGQSSNPVFAILSLVSSIVSLVIGIVCCCVSPALGLTLQFITGAMGIVFFIIDKSVNKRNNGMAIAGLVTSIVSLVLFLLMLIVMVIFIVAGVGLSFLDSYMYY